MQTAQKFTPQMQLFFEGDRPDWRAIIPALALTIAIHALLFAAPPKAFFGDAPKSEIRELELEIIPPTLEEPQTNLLPQYVEANPDANMDAPEKATMQESFQDQRAAQENPSKERDDSFPEVKGESDESNKIVPGNMDQIAQAGSSAPSFENFERPLERPSQETAKTGEQSGAQTQTAQSAPEGEGQKSESGKGNAERDASPFTSADPDADVAGKMSENFAPQTEEAGSSGESQTEIKTEIPVEETPVADMALPAPKARPSLTMRTPPGILANSNTAANRVGVIAVDSRFSEFGAYQQRMFEAIVRQWYILAARYDLGSASNTMVVVEYFLDHDGEITSFKTLLNTSTLTGKNLCEQAILSTQPYGPWTQEMRNVFGDQNQSVKITFHYR